MSVFRKSSGYCAGCGTLLMPEKAQYQQTARLYCEKCKSMESVKENWQPMSGRATVSGVFHIPAKNTLPDKLK